MRVGMVGCGKLGLPVAVAMDLSGHSVMGFDVNRKAMSHRGVIYQEAGPDGTGDFNDYLKDSSVQFGEMSQIIDHSEIVFVAVQTPHHPQYEGTTPTPTTRRDFDYSYLKSACEAVLNESVKQKKKIVLAVISTCLPGTMKREILPMLQGAAGDYVSFVYNPSFIAMSTTMRDFLHPEFVLLGHEDEYALEVMSNFYNSMDLNFKLRPMGIGEAELTKVSYNTFIGYKLVFVNTLMEICHKMGLDVDQVTDTLKQATDRLISPAYMSAGMGDGGGCHPRDQIAMSYLARELEMRQDVFQDLMVARQSQAQYLCDLVLKECQKTRLRPFVIGTAYKPHTNLDVGSSALLCKYFLKCDSWDPYIDDPDDAPEDPHVFLVGVEHVELMTYDYPEGSVVVDPWRRVQPQRGVRIVSVGGLTK